MNSKSKQVSVKRSANFAAKLSNILVWQIRTIGSDLVANLKNDRNYDVLKTIFLWVWPTFFCASYLGVIPTFSLPSVWPDVGIKCSPNFSQSSPNSSNSSFYLRNKVFTNSAQSHQIYYLSPRTFNNCPIWSHCRRFQRHFTRFFRVPSSVTRWLDHWFNIRSFASAKICPIA